MTMTNQAPTAPFAVKNSAIRKTAVTHPTTAAPPAVWADAGTADRVWERACAVTDLEPSWGEAALLRMKQIALFLLSPTEIYAVAHRDPHTAAYVMARGIVGSRGDRPTIASPLHKQVYDLGTGECFSDPSLALATYQTRVVGGFIEVAVEP